MRSGAIPPGEHILRRPLFALDRFRRLRDVLGVHQPKAQVSVQVHPPHLIQQAAPHPSCPTGVRRHHADLPRPVLQAPDPGCGFQFNVDALWSVLEESAAGLVAFIVAVNELDQLFVLEQ